ncbi:tRNA pseudouridine(55) synthase TruB [Parasphingorhabdus halotolerans]|uniref:tRNA pseudouridine synthase B n=1 Tax=Parasphingorhabdus halotolerans TaxID=2725558 RepID=A0A6H2DKY7_9SPHN|nr:tRNA pseudouridine(55) synthase TruB [Parasphingorhabdus halotolerans]QJB68615.1 tRNA pseudouridine(55) synthase TruB [Parasphingorhabdus halotolerans]
MKPHGWIILDKPLELGSTQAVGAVKRNLREAGLLGKGKNKLKVGHGGTLDPLATGVLPIAIGEATKLCGRMLDASKIYEFTIGFGTETETLDVESDVTEVSDHRPTVAEIEAVLPQFTGPIEQIPPKYSALKIDGKRAYDLARAGIEVEMKVRGVTVYSISPLPVRGGAGGGESSLQGAADDEPHPNPSPKGEGLNSITLTATVSKGTYIRSLARDIARALGTYGHVSMLRRTKAGPFTLDHAISLDKLDEIGKGADIKEYLLPLEAGLDDIPAFDLAPDQAKMLRQGLTLDVRNLPKEMVRNPAINGTFLATENAGSPVALAEIVDGTVKVVRGFNM